MPVNNFESNSCSEKICIQAKKVFDACMKQTTLQQITVSVSEVNPSSPVLPLRFVSCKSTTTEGVIDNLVVERLVERTKYGRVQADVVVPVEVTYLDANNQEGSGTGTVTLPGDVSARAVHNSISHRSGCFGNQPGRTVQSNAGY